MTPVVANLSEYLTLSAQVDGAKTAIIDGERRMSYARLDSAATALAAGLAGRGINAGDRVMLLLGNRSEFVISLFGVLRLGAVAVPVNPSLAPDEIRHAVAHVEPSLIITEPDVAEKAEQSAEGTEILVGGSSAWADLLASGRATAPNLKPQADSDALAVLLFTSGSTGRPKAAMLTHRSLSANIEQLRLLHNPSATAADDVVLGVLPLSHVYSLNTVMTLTIAVGATLLLEPRFSPSGTLDLVRAQHVTVVAGAPPIYVAWTAEPDLAESLSGVRLLTSGASALPSALFEQYSTLTGKTIWEGYGLTECSPVVATALASERAKPGSVGKPLPGVEVRLVDPSGDPGEDRAGEIYVRGPLLFSGYWPDGHDGPDEQGWWGTGDVALVDADGDLRLVDRTKELIIVSGFNVYPREVERVIEEIPGVAEVAVVGVAHPYSGEAVKAFISTRPGADLTSDEVVAACHERLARFKAPTLVEFLPELPHSGSGKIARGKLRKMAGA